MLVQLDFASFGIDPATGAPALMLKESRGPRTLMVPIGPLEAGTIAMGSMGVATEKPLPVDLARTILEALDGNLQRVVISEGGEKGTLNANLHIGSPRGMLLVECASTHAVVLALRSDSPVFVGEDLLDRLQPAQTVSPRDALRRHVASLDTVDFGSYHLEH
jgi:uncharacterized protein